MTTDRKKYQREYMRWYMAKRRKAAQEPSKVRRQAHGYDFNGPRCPENLPDRPTDGRHYVGQIELLKAQLAHTLLLWQETYEELALQIEVLTFESETLRAQREKPQARKTSKPKSAVEETPQPATEEPPVENLPAVEETPQPAAEEPRPANLTPDEQYMLDKAQGLVDPNRKPGSADDEIPF